MNAVIALCHFCEAHGPSAIFCTQTLRDTKLDELTINLDVVNKQCVACNSIGISQGIYSKDGESNANFVSTQVPVFHEVVNLIKQASVRSLSCEVSGNKDGGFVFFGDSSRGHVLSHTFHVSDYSARGFYRLFSIIILMKDKLFLLNIQPFLAESLQKISCELQGYAQTVYLEEQKKGNFERENLSNAQTPIQEPRSLPELTNEKNIYAVLHSHFAWILWAGARCLTEHVVFGSLPWLSSYNESQNQIVNIKTKELPPSHLNIDGLSLEDGTESSESLRSIKMMLGQDFVSVCYCALVGIQIVLRGPSSKTIEFIGCLKKLLPDALHKLVRTNYLQYVSSSDYRILSIAEEVAVPQMCSSLLRIDFLPNEEVTVKWSGEIPNKWPDLLSKVIKAVDESLFTDYVLEKQLKVLIHEWKNKITCLNRVRSSSDLTKLKKALGIQQHDQLLVNYWSAYL